MTPRNAPTCRPRPDLLSERYDARIRDRRDALVGPKSWLRLHRLGLRRKLRRHDLPREECLRGVLIEEVEAMGAAAYSVKNYFGLGTRAGSAKLRQVEEKLGRSV